MQNMQYTSEQIAEINDLTFDAQGLAEDDPCGMRIKAILNVIRKKLERGKIVEEN